MNYKPGTTKTLSEIRSEYGQTHSEPGKGPWKALGILIAIAGTCWVMYTLGLSPEAQRSRAERNANVERIQKVEALTEKNYKLFKEAEELVKMRPLNSVEERMVRDHARRAAEDSIPK